MSETHVIVDVRIMGGLARYPYENKGKLYPSMRWHNTMHVVDASDPTLFAIAPSEAEAVEKFKELKAEALGVGADEIELRVAGRLAPC